MDDTGAPAPDEPDSIVCARHLRALLILNAWHSVPKCRDYDDPFIDGQAAMVQALMAAIGPRLTDMIRRRLDDGRMPLPGSDAWPGYYDKASAGYAAAIASGVVQQLNYRRGLRRYAPGVTYVSKKSHESSAKILRTIFGWEKGEGA